MGYKRFNWPDFFENNQTVFYTAAIFIGIALACFTSISKFSNAALKLVLPILLFVTFLQVPFASVIKSFRNGRFIVGLLIGNFVFIPILVLVLVWLGLSFLNSLLDMPPLSKLTSANGPYLYFTAFGAMLLCAPCVDYVVSFCRSGKGDIAALTAALPVFLIFQFCFLGFLFVSPFAGTKLPGLGQQSLSILLRSVFEVLVIPICLAWFLQRFSSRNRIISVSNSFMKNSAVIVTSLTLVILATYAFSEIFSIFGGDCHELTTEMPSHNVVGELTNGDSLTTHADGFGGGCENHKLFGALLYGIVFYGIYGCLAPFIGLLAAKLLRLHEKQAIAVSFSVSTRNSLVLLPLLLFITPASAQTLVALVILTQTCVELVAEVFYVRLIPLFAKKHFGHQESGCEQ